MSHMNHGTRPCQARKHTQKKRKTTRPRGIPQQRQRLGRTLGEAWSAPRWGLETIWIWVKMKPSEYGPQVVVHVSIYQGKPFWVPAFDPPPSKSANVTPNSQNPAAKESQRKDLHQHELLLPPGWARHNIDRFKCQFIYRSTADSESPHFCR